MSTCVPLFFFSSGVLYSGRRAAVGRMFSKVLRLLLLLVFWGLIASALFRFLWEEDITLKALVLDVVTLRQQVTNWLWFLPVMSAIYLAAPFLCRLQAVDKSLFFALVVMLCIGSFGLDAISRVCEMFDVLCGSEFGAKVTQALSRWVIIRDNHPEAIAYFAVGMLFADTDVRNIPLALPITALLLSPFGMMSYGIAHHAIFGTEYDVVWNGYSCITTLFCVCALYILANRAFGSSRMSTARISEATVRIISFIGRQSFAIYIIHWLLRPAVSWIVPWSLPALTRMVVMVPICLTTVVLCAGVGSFLARTKCRFLLAG